MATVCVTGATDGIGKQTAAALIAQGHTVHLHGRDAAKVAATVTELGAAAGHTADFADLRSVRELGLTLADAQLDILINNVATYASERTETVDGHELTWQVNHLSPALLTDLLLDGLVERGGSVIWVSAGVYARTKLNLIDPEFTASNYQGQQAYAQSKLANVMVMVETLRRVPGTVRMNALHPGIVDTKLLAQAFGTKPTYDPAQGAAASVRLASDPSVADVSGAFFLEDQQRPITGEAADPAKCAALYDLTYRQVGLPGLPPA